jgi:glycosyltransferase involved in cell wall biosynthesis
MHISSISIIICCYNAASRITPVLHALQKQKMKNLLPWEVVVVDNTSTDNTAIIARQTWDLNPVTEFRVVTENRPGLMNARQAGLKAAKFNIVSFIDDDNWVEERWIEKVHEVFSSDQSIGACGGRSIPVFEKNCPDWFHFYENNFAVGRQMERSGYIDEETGFLWGAGLSFRKSLWEELQIRGFVNLTIGRQGKNITAGEDSELCYAFRLLGYRLYYRDDLFLKHYMPEGRMQFSYLERMTIGFGKANARLNAYRILLEPNFQLHRWWYEWLVAVKNVFVLLPLVLITSNKVKKWEKRILRAYNRGYAIQVWSDKSEINVMIAGVKKIFKNKSCINK